MRRAVVIALALAAVAPGAARASGTAVEIGRGHIAVGTPQSASFFSLTVAADQDSPDGFFLPAPPPGTLVRAVVTRNGACAGGTCLSYRININFHAGKADGPGFPRPWLGGCQGSVDFHVECRVRAGAGSVEVVGINGADLDVVVYRIEEVT